LTVSERLLGESALTRRQFESLLAYLKIATGEIKLKEAASMSSRGRSKGDPNLPLTIGSYYRTVAQGRKNIREALVTVLIGLWLGLIKTEDVRRLFDLIGVGSKELTEEEVERFLPVLHALLDRIVL
jgi:hypothetical protein